MKAAVIVAPHEVEIREVERPSPVPGEALVQIEAVGVCGSDLHAYEGTQPFFRYPQIGGHEVVGTVVELVPHEEPPAPIPGRGQPHPPAVGERVVLDPSMPCGGCYPCRTGRYNCCEQMRVLGVHAPGAFAEYMVAPLECLHGVSAGISADAAVMIEPLSIGVESTTRARVTEDDSVLIIGAGTIGLLAMQVLRMAGAREVIVSDVSEARLAVARQMGALHTVNPSAQDFAGAVRDLTDAQGFDLTFEAVGISATVAQSVAAVRDGGTVVWIGNSQKIVEVDMQAIVTRELQVIGSYGMNERDFSRALAMLSDGRIDVAPLITRRAALAEGPGLFDELLRDEAVIKCVIEIP